MTLIDDLLSLLRLRVEIYHNARVCGDWAIHAGTSERACFHMPSQGDCVLTVPGHGDWHLKEGDVVIFPREIPHTMASIEPLTGPQQHLPIGDAQAQPGTSMVCGVIQFHHSGAEQLIQLLPEVVVVSAEKAKQWLTPLTTLIVHESLVNAEINSPVLNRLCEVLVAYTLRCYIQNYSPENGVLALYAHPKLFKAVKAIHQHPEKPWQLESLAKEAGMSRTRFSESFKQVAEITAIEYLTWWRMQVAYSGLLEGQSVEAIAEKVGYQSEAAFARVFKKVVGKTVGVVRMQANGKP